MPPKIEELPPKVENVSKSKKKNPFATPKKTTVRRNASEVYPTHKGLNKLQYIGDKPIDLLFHDLEVKLEGNYQDLTIDVLYQRLIQVKVEEADDVDYMKRFQVLEYLLDKLIEIRNLSNENDLKDKNLIKISLHDIRTFSKVVNLIIVHGVYPAITAFKIGIPFEKRRLNHFNVSMGKNPVKIDKIPINSKSSTPFERIQKLLMLMYTKLYVVFQVQSDVKDLLSKGTGISDFLTIAITLITVPYFSKDVIAKVLSDFPNIIKLVETYELYQTYTLLLSTQSPSYFKSFVMQKLSTIHYDTPTGVLTLIEFVLGLRDNDEIEVEKYEHVSNVVLSKPKSISTVDYFTNIGNQCYNLLVNINRPMVTSCVVFILENLWNRNQMVTRDFFLKRIWNNFSPPNSNSDEILVTEAQLNNNVNVLISLTKKGLPVELLKVVFEPIILSVWSYLNFLKKNKKSTEIISGILVSYFTMVKDSEIETRDVYGLDTIAKNLLYDAEDHEFAIGPNELVQIQRKQRKIENSSKDQKVNMFITELDISCENFVALLDNLDDDLVQAIFLSTLKRWLRTGDSSNGNENPFIVLIDLRLLESIGNKFKDSLAKTPFEVLQIVQNFLSPQAREKLQVEHVNLVSQSGDVDSDDEDDFDENVEAQALPIVLELLSAILSETEVSLDEKSFESLRAIQKSLARLSATDVPSSIKSASTSLNERIDDLLNGDIPVQSEEEAEKADLKRAVTSLNDPLVPIRAHGLYLLRQLIANRSSVISLEFVVDLHLVQLKDPDPFIFLNVIKGLENLIEWDEKRMLSILCVLYLNESKETDLDERLKIGEVLLRYIQGANEMFSGESAKRIVSTALHLIRRKVPEEENEDNRLRMSSMSLLGTCCKVNPLGIVDQLENALDCALGILQFETDKDSAIMRRAGIVLIHDLIIGTSNQKEVPFPESYRFKVVNTLRYVKDTDNDILAREQAETVLDSIEELSSLAFEQLEEDSEDQFKSMRV
ncbi:hypothetical protein G9P44_000702 [Scheffersomyces stipitis]|nr:hypothetical protein G9P44_000702 [Scheffersomyces stipitis]